MQRWRRSSRCNWEKPQCVELSHDHRAVRDSKSREQLTLDITTLLRYVKR
jgi:hypothetical protein